MSEEDKTPPVASEEATEKSSEDHPEGQEKSGIPKPLLYLFAIALLLCVGSVGYRYYARLQQNKYEAQRWLLQHLKR